MICEGGEFKFFSVDHVNDPESLKTFEELDQENSNNYISEVLESSKMDKHGREHVLYPHTGPLLIYLRNTVFHNNTCLKHTLYMPNGEFPVRIFWKSMVLCTCTCLLY